MKPLRPQDLNAPILKLARAKGAVTEADLHTFLAFEFGAYEGGPRCTGPTDVWRFSASVNLARRRLLRYGLLRVAADKRLTITSRGEVFLAKGFTMLDARSRQALDDVQIRTQGDDNEHNIAEVDLPGLLHDAKLKCYGGANGVYLIPLNTKLRTWLVEARHSNGWLCLRAHVIRLPDKPLLKASLMAAAMKANAAIAVWKFCVADSSTLYLEAEYRFEFVEGEALRGLIFTLGWQIEDEYLELLKIATAPSPLDSLESAFKGTA